MTPEEKLRAAFDMSTPEFLMRIEAPHFVAGAEVRDGVVSRAAPILKYMRGWTFQRVLEYARRKGWKVIII